MHHLNTPPPLDAAYLHFSTTAGEFFIHLKNTDASNFVLQIAIFLMVDLCKIRTLSFTVFGMMFYFSFERKRMLK